MPWPKKKATTGSSKWRTEICEASLLSARLQQIAAEKWLVKYVFWDGTTSGMISIVSMQSAAYASELTCAKCGKTAKSGEFCPSCGTAFKAA